MLTFSNNFVKKIISLFPISFERMIYYSNNTDTGSNKFYHTDQSLRKMTPVSPYFRKLDFFIFL